MNIKFNRQIYSLKAIKLAIEDYKELADFNLKQDKNYIQVKIKNINKEFKKIIKEEFCNYVLGLEKS
ncbi:MAG: hypothetical protein ISS02_01200 [Candidatus Portnoybacteria bacterium]|nr:hypothetical protein [Candidatus Portnoybacteria bacterium]